MVCQSHHVVLLFRKQYIVIEKKNFMRMLRWVTFTKNNVEVGNWSYICLKFEWSFKSEDADAQIFLLYFIFPVNAMYYSYCSAWMSWLLVNDNGIIGL